MKAKIDPAMRIERIEIKDFRGFPGIYELKLGRPGHNLLVYGENGSGKSSLFQALRLFFASSEFTGSIQEYRNEFTKSDEVLVKLELVDYDGQGNRDPASGTFE
ncbi:MAG: AAA family ATPase, partial [Nitrosospira sp.]|nr:AAA family ATPase [Nitrosospira sp.]